MRIIVLFNLKPGVDPEEYEAWAASRDIPTVRALPSIAGFEVSAATGLLGGEGTPPYAYVEVIDVADMGRFGADVGTEAMQAIAAEFQGFADNPVFVTTRPVGA
ncbi:MAG: hypothetical protein JJT81_06550 [Rubellimicrobium sp.]|nr:hypothetical protein [Rubellimicrobium sp.]